MELVLIPTSYKSKVPHDLSYPVGAESISRVLLGIPQGSEIHMSFSDSPLVFKSDTDKLHKSGLFPVINATFSNSEGNTTARAYRKEESHPRPPWSLDIYAIPKTQRAKIKTLLIEHGLEKIRLWYVATRPPNWFYGRHECVVSYSVKDEALTYEEK